MEMLSSFEVSSMISVLLSLRLSVFAVSRPYFDITYSMIAW